jgi:hypothetical protein
LFRPKFTTVTSQSEEMATPIPIFIELDDSLGYKHPLIDMYMLNKVKPSDGGSNDDYIIYQHKKNLIRGNHAENSVKGPPFSAAFPPPPVQGVSPAALNALAAAPSSLALAPAITLDILYLFQKQRPRLLFCSRRRCV